MTPPSRSSAARLVPAILVVVWTLAACTSLPTGAPDATPEVAAPIPRPVPLLPEPTVATVLSAHADTTTALSLEPVSEDLLARLAAEADLPAGDLWERIRQGFSMTEMDGELVRRHERLYAASPDQVRRMTERARLYLFHIVEEIERRGMPSELALLPFIESAFNPQAVSSAKAAGMWQFIPSTGRHFDLAQNLFRDDRRDVLASTRAALDYLQYLHGMFGDWHLALAAYNWGEGSVQRAQRSNQRAGRPTDYGSLRMPAETRHYVPKLQAMKNLVAQPELFGIQLPGIEDHPYFRSVAIDRDMDLALVVKLAGLTLEEFNALNPSHNKPLILAAGTPHVLLPWDNATRFLKALATHRGPTANWTAWTVPRTMRLAEAAEAVGMTEAELRRINKIPPRMLVRQGSTLLVQRQHKTHADVAEDVANNARIALTPERAPNGRVIITARARETATTIAQRFGLAPADVARWNRVRADAWFSNGHRVVLYLQDEGTTRSAQVRTSSGNRTATATAAPAAVTRVAQASTTVAAPRKVIVTANARDTAASIARAHGLKTADVARWNRVKADAWFSQGHRVVIYLPPDTQTARQ